VSPTLKLCEDMAFYELRALFMNNDRGGVREKREGALVVCIVWSTFFSIFLGAGGILVEVIEPLVQVGVTVARSCDRGNVGSSDG